MAAILIGLVWLVISLDETVEVLCGDGIRLWRRFVPPGNIEKETSDSVPEGLGSNKEERKQKNKEMKTKNKIKTLKNIQKGFKKSWKRVQFL